MYPKGSVPQLLSVKSYCMSVIVTVQAMASYAAAVDMLRAGGGDGVSSGGGGAAIEGVSSEDMAAMRALMEEDEMAPSAVVVAEHDTLDYDVSVLGVLVSRIVTRRSIPFPFHCLFKII